MKTNNVKIDVMNDGVSYEWESYEDFYKDREQLREAKPVFIRHVEGFDAGQSWYGVTDGAAGVYRRIANGWPELREQLLAMMKGLELELPVFPTQATVRKRKIRRDDHGDTLDITRVWDGHLDTAWSRPVHTERMVPNTRRITLAFDVTANASVTNDMALWRAALCTVLVDALARAGRIMEIWVVDSTCSAFQYSYSTPKSQRPPPNLWSAWCVKRTADPVVLDRLCSMVSVGFMRTAGFTAMGCGPWTPSSGFGGALGQGLPHTLRQRREAGEVVLRIGQCYSKKAVIEEYRRAWEEVELASKEAA